MRPTLRVVGYFFLGLLSVDTLIGIVDWLGRWGWFVMFMSLHPLFAKVIRTPFTYLFFMVFGFLALWAERHLKTPNIIARYIKFRAIPDLHSATMRDFHDAQRENSGWDEQRLDWDWFVEVQMANGSETPTTMDSLEAEVSTRKRSRRKLFQIQRLDDLDSFDMDMLLDGTGKGHGKRVLGERYRSIPSLLEK
jgi:hypothetical protein